MFKDVHELHAALGTSFEVIAFQRDFLSLVGDDIPTALLLSQIYYWFRPAADGKPKLSVKKDDKLWLVKGRDDWFEECGITSRTFDRAIKILKKKGLVETVIYKFDGVPKMHIYLDLEVLVEKMGEVYSKKAEFNRTRHHQMVKWTSPNGEVDITNSLSPLTENTTEIITTIQQPLSLGDETLEDQIKEIFDHWLTVSGRSKARLSAKRKKKIKEGLKHYTKQEMLMAIDGCQANPWYLGQNDRKTAFNYPETIFRDTETIERHINYLSEKVKIGPKFMKGMVKGVVTDREHHQGKRL